MKAKQLYFLLLGGLAIVVLATVVGFFTGHKQLNGRVGELRKASADLVIANQELSRLDKLRAQYAEIRPLAEKASSVLPTQKEQDQVVAQVAKIVARQGLGLAGLSFKQTDGLPDERSQSLPAEIGGILMMPVQFETSGTYRQIQSLLLSFERQQRFMRVSTLNLTRAEGGEVTAALTLEVFFKP